MLSLPLLLNKPSVNTHVSALSITVLGRGQHWNIAVFLSSPYLRAGKVLNCLYKIAWSYIRWSVVWSLSARGSRVQLVRGEEQHIHPKRFLYITKTFTRNFISTKVTPNPNKVDVFGTGITLLGRAVLNQAVTGPCRPQLYVVPRSSWMQVIWSAQNFLIRLKVKMLFTVRINI